MKDSPEWDLVAENLPDIVVRVDRAWKFQYLNRQWELDTGLDRARCLGRSIHEVGLPSVLCDMLDFAFQRVVATRALYEFEHPCLGPNGQIHYSSRVIPELDADGEVKYCLAVCRDVTARVEAEAKLTESEERFQAFMDHNPALAWMKDADGRYVFISRLYEQRFQLARKSIYGKTDEQLWPAEVAKEYRQNDLTVLADGETREFIEAGCTPDGNPCRFRIVKFLVKDSLGRKYVGGTGVDVTMPLDRLETLSAELAAILASSPEAIVSTNHDGLIQTWNASAKRMFGYRATEIIGSAVTQLASPELKSQNLADFASALRGERIQRPELICTRQDQSSFSAGLTISPIPNADGKIVGTLHVFRELAVG